MVIKIKQASSETLPDGTWLERLTMLIAGRDVEVLRYDGDNKNVVVYTDQQLGQMPMSKVTAFVKQAISHV